MRRRMLPLPGLRNRFAVFLCCVWPGIAFADPPQAGRNQLEAGVRQVIDTHCGSCHDGARSTAKPAALKVFDLREENWTRRMSEDQLKKVTGRTRSIELTDEQHNQIAEFIQIKLRERANRSALNKSASRSGKTNGQKPWPNP